MWMLLLEAVGAGGLLVLMVWWTMFSGRREDEPAEPAEANPAERPAPGTENPPRPPAA